MLSGGHLVLIGMMGSGKTTVGVLLADLLDRPYIDNDDLVRSIDGREPASIRRTAGEAALHLLETDALGRALASTQPSVISAAAAVVEDPAARDALHDVTAVWLRARPSTLRLRIGSGSGRREEATDSDWLAQRAQAREPLYREVADLIVDVDQDSPADVARAIAEWLGR